MGEIAELIGHMLGTFLVMLYFAYKANKTSQRKYFIIGAVLQLLVLVGHLVNPNVIDEVKILEWIIYFVLLFKYLRKKKNNS